VFQFSVSDDNHGIIVNDATNDNKVDIITVTQNCVMILETKPELNAIGKNTTTITSVIDTQFHPISAVPS
jgi:hypothetical protein